ncbi:hypothetical protein L2E82_12858 [Cichorium intybus]|uniref:Uncharacterized protein n=1 Tax=Cichorium intybus TaxID=13427 RepID=A0ACB9GJ83_CICIN|nr:hypothetical protein L2E82_12858 [Cichorium intybus]
MVRSLKNPKKAKRKNKGSKKEDGSSSSNSIPSMPAKVWQPGVDALEEGEELQCDPSAYNSLHAFHIGWPCLRELVPTKTSNGDTDVDSDSSDSDKDEMENEGPKAPVFQVRKVFHEGCVNRIRAMPQKPHICATWGDTGHIWDFASHLNALAESETNISKDASTVSNQTPLVKFSGHKDEGYATDWNPLVPGTLVSGDYKNCIHLWEPSSDSTWNVGSNQYLGHTGSVEDL